jgi:hypothetical protein
MNLFSNPSATIKTPCFSLNSRAPGGPAQQALPPDPPLDTEVVERPDTKVDVVDAPPIEWTSRLEFHFQIENGVVLPWGSRSTLMSGAFTMYQVLR